MAETAGLHPPWGSCLRAFFPGYFGFDFDLSFGPLLTGRMRVADFTGAVSMATENGVVWTISSLRSDDAGIGCYFSGNNCAGITGVWRRVPEPSPLALGALGLLTLLRRSRTQGATRLATG